MFALLAVLSLVVGLPSSAPPSSSSSSKPLIGNAVGVPNDTTVQWPNGVGAEPVSDISLPKTILSSVDGLLGAGGVIQDSPENMTVYNSGVALRLLGGLNPRDQLLGRDQRVLSSYASWGVEVNASGSWLPMIPVSNSFSVLGTNRTGTYVARTMQLSNVLYSGILTIVYEATSAGPLKWNLEFDAGSSGVYRLVYAWWNVTSPTVASPSSKQFEVDYLGGNYTFTWSDVPSIFNVTSIFSTGQFTLTVLLGSLAAGARGIVDPGLIGTSSSGSSQATAYSFQRKVFFDARASRYWAFY